MLASAPLMVAQLGALELRTTMITGNLDILSTLRLTSPSTLGELFAQLRSAPPLAVLKLCNKEAADYIMQNMLQHSEDLDYVQDVLTCVGNQKELNPSKLAVLEAFNRRRSLGRLMDLDRPRFAHMTSYRDNDTFVQKSSGNIAADSRLSSAICHFLRRRT